MAEDGGVPGVGRDDTLWLALLVVFPVIDFAGHAGRTYTLTNDAEAPFPSGWCAG